MHSEPYSMIFFNLKEKRKQIFYYVFVVIFNTYKDQKNLEMGFGGVWVISLVPEGTINHFPLSWCECTVNHILWLGGPLFQEFFFN